jgi:hypothetical protein
MWHMKWTLPWMAWLFVSVAAPVFGETSFSLSPSVSTNTVGDAIQLSLQQSGDLANPSDFQWSKDGVPLTDDDRISGSQGPVLNIAAAELADSGVYSLSFTNATDTDVVLVTVTSTLYVIGIPVINDVYMETVGAGVRFTAVATGGLLSYQWTWQGLDIPGETNSVLFYADAYTMANAGYYAVRVSNPEEPGGVSSDPHALALTKPTPSGTYEGLFFLDGDVTTASCGFFQYTLSASKRSFSGKITMGANAYPFSGVLSATHDASLLVARSDGTPLALNLQLLTLNNTPQVMGSISDGTWTVPLFGNRLYYSSKTPTSLVGKYTVAFNNTNLLETVPNGSGYGAVIIQKNGLVVFNGKTADGESIRQSCGLSRMGDWPFYVRANQNRGRMLGWLNVAARSSGNITGTNVYWLKDAGPDAVYPGGFSISLIPQGSTYTRPVAGTSVFAWTNGVAGFYGGDLSNPQSSIWDFVKVYLKPPAKFTAEASTEGLHVQLNRGNGYLTGSFVNIWTGVRTPVRGAVLQQQGLARGYFLGDRGSGAFSLLPATAN